MKKLTHHLPAALLIGLLVTAQAFGQEEEELKVPEPETVKLLTKDRVELHCTFYAGGFIKKPGEKASPVTKKPGKEVVPIIMLHGWDGIRRNYDVLASGLQRMGHAVIVPDLRGHGSSTVRKQANNEDDEIDRDRLRSKTDMLGFVLDVEAVKKYLLKKNNEGELNIEMLCVVGADFGAIAAVNWAARDWTRPQLPAFRQGKDVKALVLLSPKQSHKGFTLTQALRLDAVRRGLSLMFVVGAQDRKALSDTKAIHKQVERFHKESADAPLEKKDLFKFETATSLQGTELLHARGLNVNTLVANFIELRLVRKSEELLWKERKSPLGG